MNRETMLKDLAIWIRGLIDSAKADETFAISWFKGTEDKPFSIIGGWADGYNERDIDLMCLSKSHPTYAMSVKVAVNEGPYAYTDFEIMDMPYEKETGTVDDTEMVLEWDDNPEDAAKFFLCEWERIMKEHGEEI